MANKHEPFWLRLLRLLSASALVSIIYHMSGKNFEVTVLSLFAILIADSWR